MIACHLDALSGNLVLRTESDQATLPPLWLRERSFDPEQMDLMSHQRLYDPTDLPTDLDIDHVRENGNQVEIGFSDGHKTSFSLAFLAADAGLIADPLSVPRPRPWKADSITLPQMEWDRRDDPEHQLALLTRFFETGFFVLKNTPTEMDSLIKIAETFGPIRETNWGKLFNVRTEPAATDLAYTGRGLAAHTDNPYRRSVPGIQFLHCLRNEATGGESTLVDGVAIAETLKAEAPDVYAVLTTLPVSFRYQSKDVIDRYSAPLIILDDAGDLRQLRLSTRLDFPPAADPDVLALFYRGRRMLAHYAADPAFKITFKLSAGDCLVMDNHRTLHGRTAFAADGHRLLQGCYIDHDAPECRWRILTKNRKPLDGRGSYAA